MKVVRRGVGLMFASVCALALPVAAEAAPGDLDPSFGSHGIVATKSSAGSSAYALPGGELLVGSRNAAGENVLVKLSSRGERVESFGTGGELAMPPGSEINDVAVDEMGRIVVAGSKGGAIYAARFTADGSTDQSFGDGGSEAFPSTGSAERVAIGPGGSITAAGLGGGNAFVARLTSNGEIDSGFGQDGVVATDLTPYFVEALEVADDGSVYAAFGGKSAVNTLDSTVLRLTPQGTEDPSWAADGRLEILSTSIADLAVTAERVVVLSTYLVPAIACLKTCASRAHIVGYALDGSADRQFNDAAAKLGSIGPESIREFAPQSLSIDGRSRIVVAGGWKYEGYGGPFFSDAAITRLLPSGEPDTGVGTDGLASFPNETVRSGTLTEAFADTRGRIVAAGRSEVIRLLDGGKKHDADADGVLDRSDRCPKVPGSRKDGCFTARTSLSLRYGRFGFAGTLTGRPRCISPESRRSKPRGSLIRVFEVTRGPDPMVASGRANEDGTWLAQRRPGRGIYYAAYSQRRDGDIAVCAAARSKRLRVGR